MAKKIKILALSYLFPNLAHPNHGIFVLNRLQSLTKYVDIKVINPIPWSILHKYLKRYNNLENIPATSNNNGLDVYHPRYFSIPRYLKQIENHSYLKSVEKVVNDIYKTYKFDIVDMHWTFPDLPAGLSIAKKYNTKSIVTLRGMEALHINENGPRESSVVEGLRAVDKIIALSTELKEAGERISGHHEKSVVIRNGVDINEFYYITMHECRAALGISANEKAILGVGSLIKRKGFDLLIEAVYRLRALPEYSNLKLYIVGSEGPEGDYRKHLYDQVKSLNLKNAVEFIGQVPNSELKLWYNAVDTFCLSSRGEGSPNVLSEALACGCPVVSTNVGSAREIVNSVEGGGLCMDNLSIESLFNSLKSILDSSSDRVDVAKQYSEFNWDWCAKRVLRIYEECLA